MDSKREEEQQLNCQTGVANAVILAPPLPYSPVAVCVASLVMLLLIVTARPEVACLAVSLMSFSPYYGVLMTPHTNMHLSQ